MPWQETDPMPIVKDVPKTSKVEGQLFPHFLSLLANQIYGWEQKTNWIWSHTKCQEITHVRKNKFVKDKKHSIFGENWWWSLLSTNQMTQ